MNKIVFLLIPILAISFFFLSCESKQDIPIADIILYNGKIYQVNDNFDCVEAIAIKGDTIIGVGTLEQISDHIAESTEKINLDGKAVLPGLIDAHAHIYSYAESLESLDFTGTTSKEQIIELVSQKIAMLQPGEWVIGRSWDQNDWTLKEFPTAKDLDAVSAENPVWLIRVDGHAGWANAKAMELAGISKNTPTPSGGEIIKNKKGLPTGILIDNAMNLVGAKIPPIPYERLKVNLFQAIGNCLSVGLTGIHDMGAGIDEIKLTKELIDANQFPFRVYFNYIYTIDKLDEVLALGHIVHGNDQLIIRSVKAFMDGALGSRGAALLEPYSDRPDSSGLTIMTTEELAALVEKCLNHGFQFSTHAIGDRANRMVLDAYQLALEKTGAQDARLRIEHAQILHHDDITRFAELGVIPSMQPTHCTSDLPWAIDRVGDERIKGAYAWRSLLNTGVIIPFGSDFPVENINPFFGIYSAVSRKHQDGLPEEGYFPEQKLTREDAIRGFTIWAAYAGFMEDKLGSLEVGKKADLIILDRDVMTVPENEIYKIQVQMTMVNGKFAFMRQMPVEK